MKRRLKFVLWLTASIAAAAQTPQKPPAQSPTKAPDDDQLYRNLTFGFRYRTLYGWVDRTKEMREAAASQTVDPRQGEVLLAVFERPPEAPGDTINSAVVIACEIAATYPKLKKAEDYLEPLTELTAAKGFKPDGDPSLATIDGRQLVRADFIKPITDKIAMHQSTLVLLAKGKIVSFTFIGGSEDEVKGLIESLHFTATKSGTH